MKIFLMLFFVLTIQLSVCSPAIWNVGPERNYKFCSEVSSLVSDGDTVEIDFSTYENDKQVTWSKNNLRILGIQGKPILKAGDKIANDQSDGKGIFVITGNNTVVEDIEFHNAKVVSNNGAGIRQHGSNLIVRNCVFDGNEMGILGGAINSTILIEYCHFKNNGNPNNPGLQHNIYINNIDTLIFRFNYTQDAIGSGHELKSRACNNFIEYNRISNLNSIDSRNIDLPNGGTAVILGNIIEQGQNSENSNIIGFGMEGLVNPGPQNLWIVNNTIINYKDKGSFVNVNNIDTLFMKNNICVGAKTGGFIIGKSGIVDTSNNYISDDLNSVKFVDKSIYNYELEWNSPAVNSGLKIEQSVRGHSLEPIYEYNSTSSLKARYVDNFIDIGAIEYQPPTNVIESNKGYVLIFPNPASDYIEILKPLEGSTISIFNALGECVMNVEIQNFESLQRIDISNLPAGLYIIYIYYWQGGSFLVSSDKLIIVK